jgi:hypothetical protein
LLYTQLVNKNQGDDDFISKVARTIEEARKLVEAGLEYVCRIEDAKLLRKSK